MAYYALRFVDGNGFHEITWSNTRRYMRARVQKYFETVVQHPFHPPLRSADLRYVIDEEDDIYEELDSYEQKG